MTGKELIESESSEEEEIGEWEQLRDHPDYEINVVYPHQIRKKSNNHIMKECVNGGGYVIITLNNKSHLKHRIIALQFIPNPDNLPQIDHINHNKTDNRIENLRWVSHLQNMNNKGSSWTGRKIKYVQELPDEVIVVNQYKNYHFENYYFANDVFYRDTGNGDYRIVPWIKAKDRPNSWRVKLTDTNTITRTISKGEFYHIYGLE